MFTDEIADPDAVTAGEVRADYEATLASVVEARGVETVSEESDVDAETLEALVAGDSPELTLEEAAGILATSDDYPSAEDIVLEVRDHVMLQMSSAVMDVDALESGVDGELDAKEIQQKIEGRQPMTLAEYARIYRFVASENPY